MRSVVGLQNKADPSAAGCWKCLVLRPTCASTTGEGNPVERNHRRKLQGLNGYDSLRNFFLLCNSSLIGVHRCDCRNSELKRTELLEILHWIKIKYHQKTPPFKLQQQSVELLFYTWYNNKAQLQMCHCLLQ